MTLIQKWLILAILPSVIFGAPPPPPPYCRVSGTNDAREYECILCNDHDRALREGVKYFVNGDCSFNALQSPVVLTQQIVVTEGVHIQPLDINSATPIVGRFVITGKDVSLQDLFVSEALFVQGKEVTNLKLRNITTSTSSLVLEISPSDIHHDIDVSGLEATMLQSTATTDVSETSLQPTVTMFHAYGDMTISCSADQTVIVQPLIPEGIPVFSDCNIINFTAILDAYGNAFTYEMYGTASPKWVDTLQRWAISLTAIAAGLILLTRTSPASSDSSQHLAQNRDELTKTKWV